MSWEDALAALVAMAEGREKGGVVLLRDAHGVLCQRRDPVLRRAAHAARLILCDGMPLVWLARLAGAGRAERLYGPDLLPALCAATEGRGVRHLFLGGTPEEGARLLGRLNKDFPTLHTLGHLSPTVEDPARRDPGLVDALNAQNADVLWVALGTPKQDLWMYHHAPLLSARVIIGVGAAFGFLAGTRPQAPRWLRPLGLEWAFRAATEPRRLGRRYLWTVPGFMILAGLWLLQGRPGRRPPGAPPR